MRSKPRLTGAQKAKIILFHQNLKEIPKLFDVVSEKAREEGISVTGRHSRRLVSKWHKTHSIENRKVTNECKRIISDEQLININRALLANNEITAKQIKKDLALEASESTILRRIAQLGWTNKTTQYCQIVDNHNRIDRFHFCCAALTVQDNFDDVIYIDEATVELKLRSYKHWHKSRPIQTHRGKVGKFKHSVKVHVWAGISRRGATPIICFFGKMNSRRFQNIMKIGFLPFVMKSYPFGHRLYMDNDPKHTSASTSRFFYRYGITHFKTPAQSPDLNPIEMVWNDLKYFLCTHYKPRTKSDLIKGITTFWKKKVTAEYCNSKINHLPRVMRSIVALKGKPSGL